MESILLKEIRKRFSFFGSIALLLGAAFTLCFYKAGIGICFVLYVILATLLIHAVAIKIRNLGEALAKQEPATKTFEEPLSQDAVTNSITISYPETIAYKRSYFYEAAALLLAVSNFLTASAFLHVFSTIGILLLLEFNFLNLVLPVNEEKKNDFLQAVNLLLLPIISIGQIPFPFIDTGLFFKKAGILKKESTRQILLGILIALPLLLIVIALLANADFIFSNMTSKLTNKIFLSADPFLIPLLTLFLFFLFYCIMCASGYMSGRNTKVTESAVKNQLVTTAITVVSCLTAVYLIFCGIQIVSLFFKTGLASGYTYSEYARRGFFELLAVVIINLFVILICRKAAVQSRPLKYTLLSMACCTYIMIASAAYRMILYIEMYHMTLLRLLVLWFLFVILLWITGAIVSIFIKSISLIRYLTCVITICYLLLAFGRPDYWIAKYNVTYDDALNSNDIWYLTDLSADAASVVLSISQKQIESEDSTDSSYFTMASMNYLDEYADEIISDYESRDIRDWNFSLYQAVRTIKKNDY